MKKVFRKLVVVIGIFAVCIPSSFSQVLTEKGNGNVITSERTISPFEKIKSSGSVGMYFHASDQYRAVVSVDSNLDKYIEVSTEDSVLNIRNKYYGDSGNTFTQCTVDVYCPALTDISITGTGNFECVDTIASPTLAAEILGSGMMKEKFKGDNFSLEILGSGNVTVTGTATNATVSVLGSGNFNGLMFDTKNATVAVGGSGKASIGVADNLKATLFGEGTGGQITYRGEPKIESNIKGNGKLLKM